jgi:predicted amidohydrolase YtcJ
MNILIHSGTIITMSRKGKIQDGAIAIENNRITDVGKTTELKKKHRRGYERINAKGKVVIPGLVNTATRMIFLLKIGWRSGYGLWRSR